MKTSDADLKDLDTMIRDLGLLVSSIGAWNLWSTIWQEKTKVTHPMPATS